MIRKIRTLCAAHASWMIACMSIVAIFMCYIVAPWIVALTFAGIASTFAMWAELVRFKIMSQLEELDLIAAKTIAQGEVEICYGDFDEGEDMS